MFIKTLLHQLLQTGSAAFDDMQNLMQYF